MSAKAQGQSHNPHDALFKALCENVQVTLDILKSSLPTELYTKIDAKSLKLTDKSFVSPQLRQYHSDIIYQATLNGHEGYIAFVLEHQSQEDALMAYRKLEYNVGLMRQHLKQGHKKLPVIINICIYHGLKSPYPYSTDILDCFADPVLAKAWMFKPFHLVDLSILSDEEIEKHGYAALLEYLLKHCRDAELYRQAKHFVTYLHRIGAKMYLETMLEYLSGACGDSDDANRLLQALVRELPQEESVIMTYGQQLRQQGFQQGIQQGMQQGMQQGIRQGMQKEKYEIAQKLLKAGIEDDIIMVSTGLDKAILQALKA